MRLLLIERKAATSVSRLCDDRAHVIYADAPEEALSILRHEEFDLVVLDATSFGEAGFAFIRRLRSVRNDTPLVALTGRDAADRVRALSLGADDALSQPANPGDLRACIAAVIRRHNGYSQPMVQVGALSLSLETREVWFRQLPFHLTPFEFLVLELLVLRIGQVVSKDMFLTHLYEGIDEPRIKIVDVFICKLRKRLRSVGADDLIRTIWGYGHMIRRPNEEIHATPATFADRLHQRASARPARPEVEYD